MLSDEISRAPRSHEAWSSFCTWNLTFRTLAPHMSWMLNSNQGLRTHACAANRNDPRADLGWRPGPTRTTRGSSCEAEGEPKRCSRHSSSGVPSSMAVVKCGQEANTKPCVQSVLWGAANVCGLMFCRIQQIVALRPASTAIRHPWPRVSRGSS